MINPATTQEMFVCMYAPCTQLTKIVPLNGFNSKKIFAKLPKSPICLWKTKYAISLLRKRNRVTRLMFLGEKPALRLNPQPRRLGLYVPYVYFPQLVS